MMSEIELRFIYSILEQYLDSEAREEDLETDALIALSLLDDELKNITKRKEK